MHAVWHVPKSELRQLATEMQPAGPADLGSIQPRYQRYCDILCLDNISTSSTKLPAGTELDRLQVTKAHHKMGNSRKTAHSVALF